MQYALDSVQYAENIARLLQCKVNGNLFRYIIMFDMSRYFEISVFEILKVVSIEFVFQVRMMEGMV